MGYIGHLNKAAFSTHLPYHNQPRMNPKSYSQCDPFGWLQTGVEGFYRL